MSFITAFKVLSMIILRTLHSFSLRPETSEMFFVGIIAWWSVTLLSSSTLSTSKETSYCFFWFNNSNRFKKSVFIDSLRYLLSVLGYVINFPSYNFCAVSRVSFALIESFSLHSFCSEPISWSNGAFFFLISFFRSVIMEQVPSTTFDILSASFSSSYLSLISARISLYFSCTL